MVLISSLANAQVSRYFDISIDTTTKQSTGTISGIFKVGKSSTTPSIVIDGNKNTINFKIKISSGAAPSEIGSIGWDYVGDHPTLYFSTSTAILGWEKIGSQ